MQDLLDLREQEHLLFGIDMLVFQHGDQQFEHLVIRIESLQIVVLSHPLHQTGSFFILNHSVAGDAI
ncbi:hypothetical protein SDC9_133263 [bioreactor metagenome]|uniref:Uncharacterized protein n=1 Tax=bioreactor metagenome TaxID=1076179 RepID=A0A645DAS0_9ZZZZ